MEQTIRIDVFIQTRAINQVGTMLTSGSGDQGFGPPRSMLSLDVEGV